MFKKNLEKTFCLIGDGFIGQRHRDAIDLIGGKVVDVVDNSLSDIEWKKVLDNTKATFVVILTPNDLHFEMIKRAHKLGKIVLCEKPMVLSLKDIDKLLLYENVFTVLQLRYHPFAQKLLKEISSDKLYEIEMNIAVHRDAAFFSSWKGKEERCGGVLFELGIHYLDLLLFLFGPATKVELKHEDQGMAFGIVSGAKYFCKFRVDLREEKNKQCRVFRINGENYDFSNKDNLSYENLHRYVYRDLMLGKGITPLEARKSIQLISDLEKNHGKN